MSRALRCDRCGKYYDFYNEDDCLTSVKLLHDVDYRHGSLIRYMDLCKDCSRSLINWAEGLNDKK